MSTGELTLPGQFDIFEGDCYRNFFWRNGVQTYRSSSEKNASPESEDSMKTSAAPPRKTMISVPPGTLLSVRLHQDTPDLLPSSYNKCNERQDPTAGG